MDQKNQSYFFHLFSMYPSQVLGSCPSISWEPSNYFKRGGMKKKKAVRNERGEEEE